MGSRFGFRSVCVALFSGLAAIAGAQQARDDGGAARLQAMVSQLTSEKTQLQAENKDMKAKLDTANADLKKARDQNADLQKRLGQNESALSQSNAANARGTEQAAQQRNRMDELVKQFRETIENLRQTELERNQLKTTLAAREGALTQCVASNDKLLATGNEILDRYESKGCFSTVREKEPFTQNKRVQMQNLVDGYRWQLEDQKLPESVTKAAGSAAPAAASAAPVGAPAAAPAAPAAAPAVPAPGPGDSADAPAAKAGGI
jgi:chromosome segregation ATPase